MVTKKKEAFVLSEESAQEELNRFYEYYDIDLSDLDEDDGDEEMSIGNRAIKSLQKKILKGVRKGVLKFEERDEGFFIVQTTRRGNDISYKEIDGHAKTEMGKKKDNDHSGKCYALLGYLCGEGENLIKKLKGPDLSLAEAIGTTLLLS